MDIDSLMINMGASIFYNDGFRNVLEDYMSYLRTASNTVTINIDPSDAYKYEFNLNGLLAKHNVQPYLHWIVMRLNKMTSPLEVSRDLTSLLIPDAGMINYIRQSHMTTHRIN